MHRRPLGKAREMSWLRAILGWLLLSLLMVLNGVVRQAWMAPNLAPLQAHQLSSIVGVVIILAAAWLVVPWIGAGTSAEQWALGFAWLVCTVAFEFSFGHWVAGHPWRALFADYNLAAGRLWSVVLLATTLAPWLVGRLRTRGAT